MKNQTKFLFLAFLGLVLSGLLLYALIFQGPRTKIQQIIAQPERLLPKAEQKTEVKLEISPAEATISSGETLEVRIVAESQEQLIATDLDLSFDPHVLKITEIKPGNFWSNPTQLTKVLDNSKGSLLYGIATLEPKAGQGIIATIKFEVQKTAASSSATIVKFNEDSRVSVQNHEVNLDLSSTGTYTILNMK